MKDILITYKEQILLTASFLYIPFIAFLISLANVYLFGRMLNITKNNTSKNIVATITLIGTYIFYFFFYNKEGSQVQKIWHLIIYIAISILFYVLIGFKLYDRVENLLDKVSSDEKEKKSTIHKKK
jgi:uncharacterized metal-binding protein